MKCSRRTFAALSLAGVFTGCSPVVKGRSNMDVKAVLQRDIEEQFDNTPAALDPILLGLLMQFLFGLLKQCLLQNVLRKHYIVNRRPDSKVAKSMAEQIRIGFRAKHPELSSESVESHVEASMNTFREASVEEITRLFQEQQLAGPAPTDDQWHEAAVAKTITELSE